MYFVQFYAIEPTESEIFAFVHAKVLWNIHFLVCTWVDNVRARAFVLFFLYSLYFLYFLYTYSVHDCCAVQCVRYCKKRAELADKRAASQQHDLHYIPTSVRLYFYAELVWIERPRARAWQQWPKGRRWAIRPTNTNVNTNTSVERSWVIFCVSGGGGFTFPMSRSRYIYCAGMKQVWHVTHTTRVQQNPSGAQLSECLRECEWGCIPIDIFFVYYLQYIHPAYSSYMRKESLPRLRCVWNCTTVCCIV